MDEKIIINRLELCKMVEKYIKMGSEEQKVEILYSNIISIKDKNCFLFNYTIKIGNEYINCNQIMFNSDVINIVDYYFRDKGYVVNSFQVIGDEYFDLELDATKIKDKQKTIGER